ncbi:MAG: Gfo/Idh/MocA family protein [Actinomycetota bacterium]
MTVRIGLIGCGAVARRFHLPAFRAAGAEVAAFSSRRSASAEAAAGEWGSGKVLGDWREILAIEEIDAVDVCTPNASHAEMTIAAANAGKHVLVEKPIATTLDEADAMVSAARRANVVLMTAHNVRYASPFIAVAEEIASGSLGEIRAVRAAFGHSGPQVWAPESTWYFDRSMSGGGALMDLGIHVTDLLRALLSDEVAEVGAILSGSEKVEEAAQVIMRFERGAIGSMHVSWVATPAPDHQLTIFGSNGTIHLDSTTAQVFRSKSGEARELATSGNPDDPYRAFVSAIESGSEAPVTGEDGRAALAIVLAAYRSAEERSMVALRSFRP